jgi:hypothetical protein
VKAQKTRTNLKSDRTHNERKEKMTGRSNSPEGAMTVPKYPVARLAIATAPWFGSCKGCGRELGSNGIELVGKLITDDSTSFNFQCVDCLTEFVRLDSLRQMDEQEQSDTPERP